MKAAHFLLCISILIVNAAARFGLEGAKNTFKKYVPVEGKEIITWCTTSLLEHDKCEKLSKVVMLDKGLFEEEYIEMRCKRAFDVEECMIMVDQGQASLVALDAGEVHVAGRFHSLVPIAQELYGHGEPYQYSVAVVKKGSLPLVQPGTGLHALRGAKACFPGVGSLAGWVMPVHTLMQEGGLKITDCNNHVKSATHFFGESCAPNSLKDIYNPIGDNSDKLCKLCTGGPGIRCRLADPYAGYEGALRCLIANNTGDIAFVRDTTIQHTLLSNKILGGVKEDQFELICRDGSRRAIREYSHCNWGRVPADAVVTSSAVSAAQRLRFQNILKKLVELYGDPNPLNLALNTTDETRPRDSFGNIFSSTSAPRFSYDQYNDQYSRRDRYGNRNRDEDSASTPPSAFKARYDVSGRPIELPFHLFQSNGTTDLLLQDATINFRILNEDEQTASHILRNEFVGDQAEKAVMGIMDCPVKRAVLCVTSDPEMDKCVKMRVALKAAFLSPHLTCWRGHSARHCERAVADGTADFVVLDSADMLHAAAKYRLVPFMQQVYSTGNSWYYAVAVAKEQDPDTDITYLRGKNTCHTGIGMAAGWVYPLAYLKSNGWIRPYGTDGAHAAASYFSKSCAPGALSSEYVDAGSVPHDNLCHLCHGNSFRRCRRDASEDYYGHIGALRCMIEGGGDVAFVRHSAPAEVSGGRRREWWARDLLPDDLQLLCPDEVQYPQRSTGDTIGSMAEVSGGRRREWWARDLLPDDLQLLCPDGTRAKMHEYKNCNLGKVPGAVLMGRPNHTELDTYSNLMVYAQQFYGAITSDDFSFSMFYSPPPFSDLIFEDAAVRLRPLAHAQRSAELVAGAALLRAARIVSSDAPQSSYLIASDPDFLSDAYRVGFVGEMLALALFVVAVLR